MFPHISLLMPVFFLVTSLFILYRYDEEMNELICDKLQVAYPIVNGIPYLIPTDGRLIKENEEMK